MTTVRRSTDRGAGAEPGLGADAGAAAEFGRGADPGPGAAPGRGADPGGGPGSFGPWNPGILSQIPHELRHLCTIFRPENAFTSVASATELRLLTGFPLCDLVAFRPQRLLLHELLIRVMADFSVSTSAR
jgi:hypothetical protein